MGGSIPCVNFVLKISSLSCKGYCLLIVVSLLPASTGKLSTAEETAKDLQSSDWIYAKYRRNRGIVHDGNFPHLSTPITFIKPGLKRVILGFNSFPTVLGECCMRAPEHSDAFNRTIKLYQTMAALGVPITAGGASGGGKYGKDETTSAAQIQQARGTEGNADVSSAPVKKGMNVKDIMKNPALAKLLVTAARKLKAHEKREEENKKNIQDQD